MKRLRWWHIDHVTRLARSYHPLWLGDRYCVVILRRDPPNVNQTRKAGE